MFSSRMFATLALVAAVAAYPADNPFFPHPITTITEADFDDGPSWWSFPSLDTFFAPLWKLFPSFSEIGPRIEIKDDKFRVIVNVKGYKKDDLKVKMKNDFIIIQGSHEAKDTDHDVFASQFFHTYSLPPNATDVTAVLYSNGFLEVKAALTGTAEETHPEGETEISITEVAEPFKQEVSESTESPESPETPVVLAAVPAIPEEADNTDKSGVTTNVPTTFSEPEKDRREPTTSSDREEVTEKDNSIPHGNEASEANELNEVQP